MTLVEAGTSADDVRSLDGELPEGWAPCTVREIVEISYGKGLKEADRTPGPVPVYGSNGIIGSHKVELIRGPAIILGRKGTVGAVHYCPVGCWPIDTTYFIDQFNGLDASYLAHMLRSLGLSELDTSTAIPGLNREDVYRQSVSLPPLAEQKRIVAKVEELLARVLEARERLRRVPAILKGFRQAVLGAACCGQLTSDWRDANPPDQSADEMLQDMLAKRAAMLAELGLGKRKPVQPDETQLPEFPEGWSMASMDQLTYLITSGSRGWAKYYSHLGPLFVRAQNINSDVLRLDDVAHVEPPDTAEGRRTRIRRGDLLVTITGANVTKTALVDQDIAEAYVSQHVALVRPTSPALSQFLFLWTVSPAHGRGKLTKDAYGAGKPGLSLDNIREMAVALPPADEQHEIVRRVESLFKLADVIERRVAAAALRAERLTQSILAKAFRGELVPTEAEVTRLEGRDYEPASALLERVRRDRQASGTKARMR